MTRTVGSMGLTRDTEGQDGGNNLLRAISLVHDKHTKVVGGDSI